MAKWFELIPIIFAIDRPFHSAETSCFILHQVQRSLSKQTSVSAQTGREFCILVSHELGQLRPFVFRNRSGKKTHSFTILHFLEPIAKQANLSCKLTRSIRCGDKAYPQSARMHLPHFVSGREVAPSSSATGLTRSSKSAARCSIDIGPPDEDAAEDE